MGDVSERLRDAILSMKCMCHLHALVGDPLPCERCRYVAALGLKEDEE